MSVLQAESATQICQRALGLAEHKTALKSLEDTTQLAIDCRLRYDIRRRAVLEALDWNFARMRAVTAEVEATCPPDLPYAFERPARSLRIRGVLSGRNPQKFAAETYVFCETLDDAQIIFTEDRTNPELFPPVFTTALEYLLASEFAMRFSRSVNRSNFWLKQFKDVMGEADHIEGQERSDDVAYAPGSWVNVIETPWLGVQR